jgi:hypothetical protein
MEWEEGGSGSRKLEADNRRVSVCLSVCLSAVLGASTVPEVYLKLVDDGDKPA